MTIALFPNKQQLVAEMGRPTAQKEYDKLAVKKISTGEPFMLVD